MLAEIGGHIINLDHVRRFVTVQEPATARERHVAHFADGSTLMLHATYEQITRHLGTVIPAPIGYRVIEPIMPGADEEGVLFSDSAVIAFRMSADLDWPAMPITADGSPIDDFALVAPDGKCRTVDDSFEGVEDYRRAMERKAERKP